MLNFELYNPTRIIFGKDRLDNIDKYVPANARVLITYGGGSAVKSGLIAKIKTILGNRKVDEFGGIEPNPRFTTLMKAAEIVKKDKIDFILAVGGGSVIDGTKFICLAAHYDGDAEYLLKNGFRRITSETVKHVVPFGTVLTLPATGSEMNSGAVISHKHGKYPVMSDLTFPVFSILDPTLSFTLPKIQVANGIVDAFVHTTEQYITFAVGAKLQDRFAESILQTLIEIGETTVKEPENYVMRANHYWSATLALNGLIGAGVPQDWATHMIGHELTHLFGIDHAQTLAIILPALLEVRRKKKHAKLLQYAERVWDIKTGTEDEKITNAIRSTREFFERLGIKTRLSEYGVKSEQLETIVDHLKAHGLSVMGESDDHNLETSREILKKAF